MSIYKLIGKVLIEDTVEKDIFWRSEVDFHTPTNPLNGAALS